MIESLLLWAVAAVAAILILQYVMKAPHTPERPAGGLGKRFPIGPRRIESDYAQSERPRRPVRRRPTEVVAAAAPVSAAQLVMPDPQPEYRRPRKNVSSSVITAVDTDTVATQPPAASIPTEAPIVRSKKRTDTMQLMLDRAISERR